MKRFYREAIKHIEGYNKELGDDINNYVCYLEHIKNVLISELSRSNTIGGNLLLSKLGIKKEKPTNQELLDDNFKCPCPPTARSAVTGKCDLFGQ